MPLQRNNWDGIGNGTTLTAANSANGGSGEAVSALTTGSFVVDSAAAAHGPVGLRHVPVASTVREAIWNFTAADRCMVSLYFRIAAALTATSAILQLRNASSPVVALGVSTTPRLQVSDGGGLVYNDAAANLVANTWYRLELRAIRGTTTGDGTVEFGLYVGDSTTPQASYSSAVRNVGTTDLTNLRWGRTSTATADVTETHFDSLQLWSGVHTPTALGRPWRSNRPQAPLLAMRR